MTHTSTPPSAQAQTMLRTLQNAVAKNLEKKQKLGQYAVVWQNGRPVQTGADAPKTICDALQPPATKPINLAVLRGRAEPGVTVTDAEVRAAQRFAFNTLRLVVEPGGAAALAAALAGKVLVDGDTVIMLTGGNADPAAFAATIAGDG